MSLEQRVRKLERQMSELRQTAVRRRLRIKGSADPEAEKWIMDYLAGRKGAKTLDVDLSVVPPRAEVVYAILDAGRKAGFTPLRLRQARMRMENVIVEHVKGSKQWMWRLLKA